MSHDYYSLVPFYSIIYTYLNNNFLYELLGLMTIHSAFLFITKYNILLRVIAVCSTNKICNFRSLTYTCYERIRVIYGTWIIVEALVKNKRIFILNS